MLQHKLNYKPHRTSTFKVRIVIEKEQDPVSWEGDVWKGPDEDGNTESLNSDETSLPMEAASPLPGVTFSSAAPD